MDWQQLSTGAIVATAALYVARQAWAAVRQRQGGSCGRCGTCAASQPAAQTHLVQLSTAPRDTP